MTLLPEVERALTDAIRVDLARHRRRLRGRWRPRSRTGAVALVLCLASASAFAATHWTSIETAVRHGAAPPAPPLSLPPLGSKLVPDSWIRDYPRDVVLSFWASWCTACQAQLRTLAQLDRDLSTEHRGTVLLVDVRDKPRVARATLERLHIHVASLEDHTGAALRRYGAVGVPTTFIVDGRGRVVAFTSGRTSLARLERLIAKAGRA